LGGEGSGLCNSIFQFLFYLSKPEFLHYFLSPGLNKNRESEMESYFADFADFHVNE
jgi:hypothetical protein